MKIDRNLIDKQISDDKKSEFEKYLRENLIDESKVQKRTFFSSRWSVVISILIIFASVVTNLIFIINNSINFAIIIVGIVGILSAIFILMLHSKAKIDNNNEWLKDINFLEVTKKWFKNYGIKGNDIKIVETLSFIKLIKKYSFCPKNAYILEKTPGIEIKNNGITTVFIYVTWQWEATGLSRKTYTEGQFYMFDYGMNPKWNGINFTIYMNNQIINKKNETLMSKAFNKKFDYKYDNGTKLRMILTPRTQELLLNKFAWKQLSIIHDKKFNITTAITYELKDNFSPFSIYPEIYKTPNEKTFKSIIENITNDYIIITKFMGHARLLYPMYKK